MSMSKGKKVVYALGTVAIFAAGGAFKGFIDDYITSRFGDPQIVARGEVLEELPLGESPANEGTLLPIWDSQNTPGQPITYVQTANGTLTGTKQYKRQREAEILEYFRMEYDSLDMDRSGMLADLETTLGDITEGHPDN